MQLKRLFIKDYKILKDFTIEFPYDFQKYISVFIGANGSGKSTILEVIAQIFSNVLNVEKSKFGFELEFTLKNIDSSDKLKTQYYFVRLFSDDCDKPILANIIDDKGIVRYNGGVVKEGALRIDGKTFSLVPDDIVIYYSGLSGILENMCKPHEIKISKAYRKGYSEIDRNLFYYKPEHFEIILLSLLSFEYGDIPEFLKTKARIEDIKSIQINFKKPSWADKETIENFWGAKGDIRVFLDYLKEKSQEDNIIQFKATKEEKLTISLKGKKALYKIREFLIEERKLFEILNIMLFDGLLDNISFSLLQNKNGNPKSFNILSEGEQQIITIKGLTELLSGTNTLFLFDEPDTYLHPSWQRQFINEIEKNIENSDHSENSYIIATHSPQLLSNAKSELNFVKIIENGSLVEKTPKFYGREISSILYNLMGVEERNETIKKDLSKLFILLENEETQEAEKELIRLTKILGDTDPDINDAEIQLKYLKEDEANNQE